MALIQPRAQTNAAGFNFPTRGTPGAPIVILCEPQSLQARKQNIPMTLEQHKMFAKYAMEQGFEQGDVMFVSLCPPMPESALSSAARRWAHVEPFAEQAMQIVRGMNPRCLVTFGELATRVATGGAVKITKVRGIPQRYEHLPFPILPMLSPGYVQRIPNNLPAFNADLGTLARVKAAGYDISKIMVENVQYEYRTDITDLLTNLPRVIGYDTETTGLVHWDPNVVPIVVQISTGPGKAIICPVHPTWWDWSKEPPGQREHLIMQLKSLLENKNVRKMAHNKKFDHMITRKIGIEIKGWLHDTQMMAFNVNEDMLRKSLDECVRIWVPEMAGYSDEFDRTVDKSRMLEVPPFDQYDADGKLVKCGMLNYAGGDADAVYRLARALDTLLRADARQQNVYRRVQMPSLASFGNVMEVVGTLVDQPKLREFEGEVRTWYQQEYRNLIRMVPVAVRRKHMNAGKDLAFSRDEFVRDTLFSEQGFGLKPVVYTPSTEKLCPPHHPVDARVPSASANDHMPYFIHDKRAGEFVTRLIDFQKTNKLLTTYIGDHTKGTGFWQYIAPNSRIYPSYKLHATNTGRTASENPNGQNFPKRGRFAKSYSQIFVASPGFVIVGADLSQIELRIAAWMSGDQTMLEIYRSGGDIHLATAARTLRVDPALMARWKRDERILVENGVANEIPGVGEWLAGMNPGKRAEMKVKDYVAFKRFQAKAINFGFLYGMQWKGFRDYAKTDYGLDYSEQEAKDTREAFFDLFKSLQSWHDSTKAFAHEHGYVRALHGACRHLPDIYSTDNAIVAMAERQAINAPVQRFGSDLGLIAMNRFNAQADPRLFRVIGFVHDQLLMEARIGYEREGGAALKWCMETPPLEEYFGITPPLPIVSEVEIGENLGELEEIKDIQSTRPEWWNDDEKAAWDQFIDRGPVPVEQHIHIGG